MKIEGCSILVTGAASGLGEGVARRLAGLGARITIADLHEARGAAVAADIGGTFVRCDVTSEADGERAVAAAVAACGSLSGLVNCAGIAAGSKTIGRDGAHPLATFTRVVTVNLIGSFNMIRLAALAMARNHPNEEAERGVIVNTASVAAYDGQIGQAAYSASKGGIVGMTLPVARDLAREGIRVMTIAPGIFQTPLLDQLTPEIQASLGAQVPFPSRLGRASEYAALAQHIFENAMLNGEVIRLDGAIRLAPR